MSKKKVDKRLHNIPKVNNSSVKTQTISQYDITFKIRNSMPLVVHIFGGTKKCFEIFLLTLYCNKGLAFPFSKDFIHILQLYDAAADGFYIYYPKE